MEANVILTTIIIGVLSFIVATQWQDLFETIIETYAPSAKSQLRWKTVYVFFSTFLLILLALILIPRINNYLKKDTKENV